MNTSAERVPLADYLNDVRTTSNRLLTDLCEPADELGLGREEHLVLLMLWDTDGTPEQRIAERLSLSAALVEQALRSLQQKALVERDSHSEAADVWLTHEGRRVRERLSKEEMSSRLRVFGPDIAELRDMLHRALDLIGEEMAGFEAEAARA